MLLQYRVRFQLLGNTVVDKQTVLKAVCQRLMNEAITDECSAPAHWRANLLTNVGFNWGQWYLSHAKNKATLVIHFTFWPKFPAQLKSLIRILSLKLKSDVFNLMFGIYIALYLFLCLFLFYYEFYVHSFCLYLVGSLSASITSLKSRTFCYNSKTTILGWSLKLFRMYSC